MLELVPRELWPLLGEKEDAEGGGDPRCMESMDALADWPFAPAGTDEASK